MPGHVCSLQVHMYVWVYMHVCRVHVCRVHVCMEVRTISDVILEVLSTLRRSPSDLELAG